MKILVTGVTGSLGSILLPALLEEGHSVVGYSRCELKQSQVQRHRNLTLYMGDVRDRDRLLEASRGVELIYHLAAIKRIEAAEEQPEEAIATNILGTENVLFAQRMHGIRRVVLVSTDKACLPITTYGATKFVGERLVLRNPNNVVCRYGNVLASRGSVLQAFVESITKSGAIFVTSRSCTRFWWPLSSAAAYVQHCGTRPLGGLGIPALKAYPVVRLGKMIADILGRGEPRVIEVGLRGAEKIHEHLRATDEGGEISSGDEAHWYTPGEIRAVLEGVVQEYLRATT